MPWFVIDPSGYRYPVDQPGLKIGRASDNDVVLNDDEVSRYHAFVQAQADKIWLYDRESSNGVFVGGQRITGPLNLKSGTNFRVGRTTLAVDYVPIPGTVSPSSPQSGIKSRSSSGIWQAALIGGALGLVGLALVLIFFVRPIITNLSTIPVTAPTSANIYDDALGSIAFLLTPIENSTRSVAGTGVVMTENGRLLTAYSLVYDPNTDRPYNRKSQVLVGLNSSGRYTGKPPDLWYQGRVVRADRQRDLAVLQIFARDDGSPLPNSFRLNPASSTSSNSLQTGNSVSIISYQGGLGADQAADSSTVVLGQGTVLGFLTDLSLGSDRSWIQSDIGMNSQHAGGLALDQMGNLVGLYTGVNAAGEAGAGSMLRPIDIAQPLLVGAPQ